MILSSQKHTRRNIIFILKALTLVFLVICTPLFGTRDSGPSQKQFISWDQFHQDTLLLVEKIKEQGPWDGIIAITRGGLVPAAILSHALNIKIIDTIGILSYDEETRKKTLKFKILKNTQLKQGKWLIVDDLVDTGDTAEIIKEMIPEGFLVAVYAKPKGESSANIFAKKINQNIWIVFPWEEY